MIKIFDTIIQYDTITIRTGFQFPKNGTDKLFKYLQNYNIFTFL